MSTKPRGKTNRLTREQWLQKSLDLLISGKHGKLRIENVTKELNVTKGSFYWHFKDRADYITSLAEYWDRLVHDDLINQASEIYDDYKERMAYIIRQSITRKLTAYDAAMQMLANKEPYIEPIVTNGFKKRMLFVDSVMKRFGFKGQELELRKHLLVSYFLLDTALMKQSTQKKRLEKALYMLDFLTQQR
jgi:AcrR family transcriptional regulator